jgi:hypothetical protein
MFGPSGLCPLGGLKQRSSEIKVSAMKQD